LSEHGAYVGINFHQHHEAAEEVLATVKQENDGILVPGNIAEEAEVKTMIEAFVANAGRIDILVNNAGIYQRALFAELASEQWHHILGVNLDGSYYVTHHALPYVPDQGRIIFISSQLAFKGSAQGTDYATTKAGMLGFMRSLARELGPRGITVNAVAPGTIETDMIASFSPEKRAERIAHVPLGRLGTPQDVANVCLFLTLPWANYITGETINVNGGLYIH
jgi:3-oxoacyl-[acyl-carrier protein] reductase